MISQAHRFHGRNSLRFVYQRGQHIRGGAVALRFVANPRRRSYRVAVVVSRKVSKSAVVRNRIRRRIYELVRDRVRPAAGPLDLVFTVYDESAATLAHESLQEIIVTLLAKAGASSPDSPDHAIVEPKESNT